MYKIRCGASGAVAQLGALFSKFFRIRLHKEYFRKTCAKLRHCATPTYLEKYIPHFTEMFI